MLLINCTSRVILNFFKNILFASRFLNNFPIQRFFWLRWFYYCHSKCPINATITALYSHRKYCKFKVNNRNTRTSCKMCSKFTIKTPERRNDVVLVSSLLTLTIFTTFSSVSFVDFEQINVHWIAEIRLKPIIRKYLFSWSLFKITNL